MEQAASKAGPACCPKPVCRGIPLFGGDNCHVDIVKPLKNLQALSAASQADSRGGKEGTQQKPLRSSTNSSDRRSTMDEEQPERDKEPGGKTRLPRMCKAAYDAILSAVIRAGGVSWDALSLSQREEVLADIIKAQKDAEWLEQMEGEEREGWLRRQWKAAQAKAGKEAQPQTSCAGPCDQELEQTFQVVNPSSPPEPPADAETAESPPQSFGQHAVSTASPTRSQGDREEVQKEPLRSSTSSSACNATKDEHFQQQQQQRQPKKADKEGGKTRLPRMCKAAYDVILSAVISAGGASWDALSTSKREEVLTDIIKAQKDAEWLEQMEGEEREGWLRRQWKAGQAKAGIGADQELEQTSIIIVNPSSENENEAPPQSFGRGANEQAPLMASPARSQGNREGAQIEPLRSSTNSIACNARDTEDEQQPKKADKEGGKTRLPRMCKAAYDVILSAVISAGGASWDALSTSKREEVLADIIKAQKDAEWLEQMEGEEREGWLRRQWKAGQAKAGIGADQELEQTSIIIVNPSSENENEAPPQSFGRGANEQAPSTASPARSQGDREGTQKEQRGSSNNSSACDSRDTKDKEGGKTRNRMCKAAYDAILSAVIRAGGASWDALSLSQQDEVLVDIINAQKDAEWLEQMEGGEREGWLRRQWKAAQAKAGKQEGEGKRAASKRAREESDEGVSVSDDRAEAPRIARKKAKVLEDAACIEASAAARTGSKVLMLIKVKVEEEEAEQVPETIGHGEVRAWSPHMDAPSAELAAVRKDLEAARKEKAESEGRRRAAEQELAKLADELRAVRATLAAEKGSKKQTEEELASHTGEPSMDDEDEDAEKDAASEGSKKETQEELASQTGDPSMDDEDEDDEKEFASETIKGEGALEDYSFEFKLAQHFEYNTVLRVSGKAMHEEKEVGTLKGLLIDRSMRPYHNFFSLCDSESEELQELGAAFCERDGSLRKAGDIDGMKGLKDREAAHSGGFLYIAEVELEEAHRHKDVGIVMAKELMEWLNRREEEARAERKKYRIESQFVHSSWSLCVLTSWMLHPREAADAAALDEANRKIAMQWVRLGFMQASFGSNNFYLTPSCLKIRSKSETSKIKITKLPEKRKVNAKDRPLLLFLHKCDAGRPPTFAKDVEALVKGGARPGRLCALAHAVVNGITSLEDLGLLCSLGASVQDTDEIGYTALHAVAEIINKSEREETALEAATSLLALGASRSAKSVHGWTPLELLRRALRAADVFRNTFRLPAPKEDRQLGFELAAMLLEDAQRSQLIGGALTPRQHMRMHFYADNAADRGGENFGIEFVSCVPVNPSELGDITYWRHVPLHVRQQPIFKSFVLGWAAVLKAIQALLKDEELPTAKAVEALLTENMEEFNSIYVNFFFKKGGKCEHALDGLVHECIDSEFFFDIIKQDLDLGLDDDNELNFWFKYNALPEHPFDEWWDFLRYHLGGPEHEFKKGPFFGLSTESEDDDNADDGDKDEEEEEEEEEEEADEDAEDGERGSLDV